MNNDLIFIEETPDFQSLDRFKISEDSEKIVWELPIGVFIDLHRNREYLHSIYKNVEISITAERKHIQTITAFKKQ